MAIYTDANLTNMYTAEKILRNIQGLLDDSPSTVTYTHTAVPVGAATTLALAENPDRKYALFVNDSDTTIYLMIGAGAAANQGIRLNANGGSFEMSAHYGNLATVAINAISSGANKNLLVTEGE